MKKIILAICASMLAGMGMAQTVISDEAGLRTIADNMDGDYILTADITLSSDWTPLGTPSDQTDVGSFNGTLDGNGHSIIGLHFEISDPDVIYMGLFGRIGSEGVVKDLIISRISDSSQDGLRAVAGNNDGTRNIGTIAGVNHGVILNCRSDVGIACYARDIDGGGIAGENAGLIKNCVFTGAVVGGNYTDVRVGGIVGDNENGGRLQNCLTNTTITGGSNVSPLYGQDNGEVNDCAYQYRDNDDQWCVRLEGRTLYKDGNWNTLCLPFDVTIASSCLNGATIMELDTEENGYEHVTGIEESTLYLNFKDVTDQIEAGKPYIIKWNQNQNNLSDPDFTNASLTDLIDGTIEPIPVTSADDNVSFTGVFFSKDIEASEGNKTLLYLGAANTLYYPNAPMSINSLRAYFQLNNGYVAGNPVLAEEPVEGGANRLTFHVSNQATGINDTKWSMVNGQWSMNDGQWYDLSGRSVDASQLKNGLYIKDGKKILIRR